MTSITFHLVSPERQLMEQPATMVTVPGEEGEFGVLAGHAPLMTTLRPGVIHVEHDGDSHRLFVRGGFAEISNDTLTILAEEAVALDDLDAAALDQHIQDIREDLDDAADDPARDRITTQLEHLIQLRTALGR